MLICNAFSLNMLRVLNVNVAIRPLAVGDVQDFADSEGLKSAVGHPDTAALFSVILGIEVLPNRQNLALGPNDRLIVGQYRGPRLEAGATELPVGATIEWCLIAIGEGRSDT